MKKVFSLALAVMMLITLFAGCTPADSPAAPGAGAGAGAEGGTAATPAPGGDAAVIGTEGSPTAGGWTSAGGITYPIQTDEYLTFWVRLNAILVAPNFSNFNDTDFAQFLEEDTGVRVEYISPPVGQEAEAFSLMVASGDMPDIIDMTWHTFPGGPAAALMNNVILPLNDLIPTYAPDLNYHLRANPDFDRMVKTDDGYYYLFPVMRLDEWTNTTAGLVVRWDWLDYLGLDLPETIEDWHYMLTAFRDVMGADYPLTFAGWGNFRTHMNHSLIGAYGTMINWFIYDDEVVYGPFMPGYRDWLIEMARWYSEGLIDPNFATNDQAAVDSNLLNHQSGATALWLGSGLGRFIPALRTQNENYTLGPVRYPVLNRGDTPMFSSLLNPFNGEGAAITTSARNPELAAKFLNFGYTEVGAITWGFGREGISFYRDEQGLIQLTEAVTDHERGWGRGQAWAQFSRGVYPGPFYAARRWLEIYYQFEEQVLGLEFYTDTNMREHLVPMISPSPDEASRFARIMSDVIAHVDEYTLTAILGITDVEATWDTFIEELRQMGIEEAIEIQNAALERYYLR